PVAYTRDEIVKELLEGPGQVVSDIERMKQMPYVYIDSELAELRFSRKFSKIFGAVPRDVTTTEIAAGLRESGIQNFIALGIGYTKKELQEAEAILAKELGIKGKTTKRKK